MAELHKRTHASKPRNKLIAQVFYDLEIIERYGSGIQRILDACAAAGLPEPTFSESTGGLVVTFRKAAKASGRQQQAEGVESQPESRPESQPESQPESLDQRVMRLVKDAPLTKARISAQLGQKKVSGQLNKIIRSLVREGVLEYTIPAKPNSRLQKYRLTAKGKAVLQRGKG